MKPKLKVLQVIPKLGYGGAETGCYDLAHYLSENNCLSFIVTSGGNLAKYVDRKKVKLIIVFLLAGQQKQMKEKNIMMMLKLLMLKLL